jgi:hypothetical protein
MTVANFDDESKLLDIDCDSDTSYHLPRWILLILILVLTSSASFGLGMLTEQSISSRDAVNGGGSSLSVGASPASMGQIIGDSSTRQYYLPWCSQVASISAADTVSFANAQDAEAKGYTAGKDCAGL